MRILKKNVYMLIFVLVFGCDSRNFKNNQNYTQCSDLFQEIFFTKKWVFCWEK